jgi:hypothetical protein
MSIRVFIAADFASGRSKVTTAAVSCASTLYRRREVIRSLKVIGIVVVTGV